MPNKKFHSSLLNQEESQIAENKRLRKRSILISGICLLVAACTSAWILTVENRAHSASESAILVSKLHAETNLMCSLAMQGIAEPEFAKSIVPEAVQASVRSKDELGRLRALSRGRATAELAALVAKYVDLNLQCIRLNANGKYAAAHELDTSYIDPIEGALWNKMASADQSFSDEAARSSSEATVGTVVSLTLGAFAITLLFWRLERSVRASTQLQAHQDTLLHAEKHWSSLIQNLSEIIILTDSMGRITFASPAIESLLGLSQTEIVGKPLHALVHGDDVVVARAVMEQANNPNSNIKQEWRLVGSGGVIRTCEVAFNNLLSEPDVNGILVTLRDVTERHEFELQLTHQAFHDALTGLPN